MVTTTGEGTAALPKQLLTSVYKLGEKNKLESIAQTLQILKIKLDVADEKLNQIE